MKKTIITIRVTPEEHKRILDAAAREDRTISAFGRLAVMDRVSKKRK